MLKPLRWSGNLLELLDQRLLPRDEVWIQLRTHDEVADAITAMAVRGAPAIGIAAAYGLALAVRNGEEPAAAAGRLVASRPTAVNLAWAVGRVLATDPLTAASAVAEAQAIEAEDLAMNLEIGRLGAALIPGNANVLTICNTGALATAGHGTALGIIRSAHADGKHIHVWASETRPRQQGLRLTAYELLAEGIPFHAIADGAAAPLMAAGRVDCVVVGADRIAANGDVANKLGTYMLAVLAHHHHIPLYVAAPSSTIDQHTPSGAAIPIEERDGSELTHIEGIPVAPAGAPVYNPAFDVTPGALISAIITEAGVFRAPYNFGGPDA
ncbi:MAG: S-methyl-5-thioribose-1-phosphate isomerase [Fimbriimonadaceae bacterium]